MAEKSSLTNVVIVRKKRLQERKQTQRKVTDQLSSVAMW